MLKIHGQFSASAKGIVALCAMAAVFCFSLNDALIKFLSGSYALHQIVLVRSVIGIVILLVIFIPLNGTFSVFNTSINKLLKLWVGSHSISCYCFFEDLIDLLKLLLR